jgi:iron(III) transport system ATP-binding protein
MGSPDEIYNRPADLFVANFTGATNELTGTLVARNGAFGVVDFGQGRSGEAALLHDVRAGDKVRIALRPETLRIGGNGDGNVFPAEVTDRRYQGTQTVYDIALFGRRLEALELGTAARHEVGATTVALAREGCWAYRDEGAAGEE